MKLSIRALLLICAGFGFSGVTGAIEFSSFTIEKKVQCAEKDLKAEDGWDKYRWFLGPTSEAPISTDSEHPTLGRRLVDLEDNRGRQEIKQSLTLREGVSTYYVLMETGDLSVLKRYDLDIKRVKPKIKVSPSSRIQRASEIKLETKDKYKKWEWHYFGLVEKQHLLETHSDECKKSADSAALKKAKDDLKKAKDALEVAQKALDEERKGELDQPADLKAAKNDTSLEDLKLNLEKAQSLVKKENEKVAKETRKLQSKCIAEKYDGGKTGVAIVWSGDNPVAVDETARKKVAPNGGWLPRDLDTEDDGTAKHHPLFSNSLYGVKVTDSNGCTGWADPVVVHVDQQQLNFALGVEFTRAEKVNEDEEASSIFDNPQALVGIRAHQYLRRFFAAYGQAYFGGTNIQLTDASNDPIKTLEQVTAFQLDLGVFYDITCGPSAQTCFYAKAEYGFAFPEEDLPREDLIDRSFFGLGWRYHNPGAVFHGSFAELGSGRSDNFVNNSERIKVRGVVLFDLAETWDVFLIGELDADGGTGEDEIRVTFGLKRDLSFLGEVVVKTLGFGEKKEEEAE